MLTLNTNVDVSLKENKRRSSLLFPVTLIIGCCATILSVLMAVSLGVGLFFGLLIVLVVLALIVWRPIIGCYIALATVVLIESEPLAYPVLTDRLPVFYWPSPLTGFIERPIGLLLIFTLFVLLCRRLINRERLLSGGKLLIPFVLFLLCVIGGIIHGLASGGNFQETIGEIRPFWYLFLSYLLATNIITKKSQIYTLIWIIILGAFVKGLQGVYLYLVVLHGNLSGNNTIMAHEESFFFVGLILLVVLFILHFRYRPQFWVSLLIVPFVLIALVANQRRADYIALLVAIGVIWLIIYRIRRKARGWLIFVLLVSTTLLGSYILIFANASGPVAAPARGIVSVFVPSASDVTKADSNLYRKIENNDLIYTAKQDPILGVGFGKPFLQPIPLTSIYPQILRDDPVYNYVPHNSIYWILMRLGAVGFLVFWYLISNVIVNGCMIVRKLKDPYLQLVAIYILAMVFVEILVAYGDYQLYFLRNVIYIGLLLGVLMQLPSLADERS